MTGAIISDAIGETCVCSIISMVPYKLNGLVNVVEKSSVSSAFPLRSMAGQLPNFAGPIAQMVSSGTSSCYTGKYYKKTSCFFLTCVEFLSTRSLLTGRKWLLGGPECIQLSLSLSSSATRAHFTVHKDDVMPEYFVRSALIRFFTVDFNLGWPLRRYCRSSCWSHLSDPSRSLKNPHRHWRRHPSCCRH